MVCLSCILSSDIFRENCGEKMEEFLKRCFYHTGQYDSQEHFVALDKKLKEHEVLDVYPPLINFFMIPLQLDCIIIF